VKAEKNANTAAKHIAEVLKACSTDGEQAIASQVVAAVLRLVPDWRPDGEVSGLLALLEQVPHFLPERDMLRELAFVPAWVHLVPPSCAGGVLRVLVAMVMSTTSETPLTSLAEVACEAIAVLSRPDDEEDLTTLETSDLTEAIAWGVEQLMGKAEVTSLPIWPLFLTQLAVQCAQVRL